MEPQMRVRAEALILEAGRSHGLITSQSAREEVQRALDDPERGPAFAEWAITHLGPDNLLTADEVDLYSALDKSGEVDRLASLYDLEEVQAVSEDELKAAIEELNRSTDAISKQTETLQQQQEALSRLVKKASDNDTRRKDFEQARWRRSEAEQKYAAAEVEGLAQTIGIQIADLEEDTRDLESNIQERVDTTFISDDKLLSSLEKLGNELKQPDPEEAEAVERFREVCARLTGSMVETVRTKLDRIYLEALVDAERSGHARPATDAEVKELQDELESLYAEIVPVAQMSVEKQYLQPVLKSISAKNDENLYQATTGVAYINECLDYMLERSQRLKDVIQTAKSHQLASEHLITTAKAELSLSTEAPPPPQKPIIPISPARVASPVRTRTNTANSRVRRRSSITPDEPPIDSLLNSLSIFMGDDMSGPEKVKTLASTLSERSTKAVDVTRNAQENFENIVSAHLNNVQQAVQLLRDSLFAESPYGDLELIDPEVKSSIDVLIREVQSLQNELSSFEKAKLTAGNAREEFMHRWGS